MSELTANEELQMNLSRGEAALADIVTSMGKALLMQIGECDHRLKLAALLSAATVIIEGNYAPKARTTVLNQLLSPTLRLWMIAAASEEAAGATKQ